jgi:hypothetical protein
MSLPEFAISPEINLIGAQSTLICDSYRIVSDFKHVDYKGTRVTGRRRRSSKILKAIGPPNTSVEPTAYSVSIRIMMGSLFASMSFHGPASRLWPTSIR